MKNKLLSIIIVNYNGEQFLRNCIESIHKNCQGIDYEIVIVDNNSSDKSVNLIKAEFPSVILIENKENDGFAKGNNIGVKNCRGKYILLLNNDTILLDNLKPAIDLIIEDSNIGIIGIRMLDEQDKFVASFGKFPKIYNFFKLSTLQIDMDEIKIRIISSPKKPILVDWISGAFLLTTNQLWKQVGGLDEAYFMYVEDVDYNKKVQVLGKKSLLLPSLRFIHYVGFNKNREKQLIKSYKIYIRNHKKGIGLITSLFMLNFNLLIKIALKRV